MEDRTVTEAWLNREQEQWNAAFETALDEAILHLQALIFDEGWDRIVAEAGSPEAALRESVVHYERGLANLFSFVRASGSLVDAIAWSTMKVRHRRTALESGVEITLRTALETGLYVAERTPLGDHTLYTAWVRGLILFLVHLSADAPDHPGPAADHHVQLEWAYAILTSLEDPSIFHAQFGAFLRQRSVEGVVSDYVGALIDTILQHEDALLAHPRFDLLLNTALIWLASAGGRRLEYLSVEEPT